MAAEGGFFSRWSQRKTQVREGQAPQDPAPLAPELAPVAEPRAESAASAEPMHEAPLPTLAHTQQLTPESDFSGFMARGVTPDVKNAAMKKLFTDPHFNVMDRMDVYIDDYTQPDPLPLALLRQMTSVDALNLFDDAPPASQVSPAASVAQQAPLPSAEPPPTQVDDV